MVLTRRVQLDIPVLISLTSVLEQRLGQKPGQRLGRRPSQQNVMDILRVEQLVLMVPVSVQDVLRQLRQRGNVVIMVHVATMVRVIMGAVLYQVHHVHVQ